MKNISHLSEALAAAEIGSLAHFGALRRLAVECPRAIEIGPYEFNSSLAILQGLSENRAPRRSFLAIDIYLQDPLRLEHAKQLAALAGIEFRFEQANDLDLEIPETDLLHIDSYHTYRHLSAELMKFAPRVRQYILIHDTSAPFGYRDEYGGELRIAAFEHKYPAHLSKTKQGLWPAVEDFLADHPDWQLYERDETYAGYTVLKRRGPG